jgi:hypothetical protein
MINILGPEIAVLWHAFVKEFRLFIDFFVAHAEEVAMAHACPDRFRLQFLDLIEDRKHG